MSSYEECVSGGTVCTQQKIWRVSSTAAAVKDHEDSTPFGAGAGDLGEDDVEISFRSLPGPALLRSKQRASILSDRYQTVDTEHRAKWMTSILPYLIKRSLTRLPGVFVAL